MAEGWVSAASISLVLTLLSTYGYLVPSVLALPGKKFVLANGCALQCAEGRVRLCLICCTVVLFSVCPPVWSRPTTPDVRAEDDAGAVGGGGGDEDPSGQPPQPRAAPLLRRSFRLEDFLWTGSGDGPDDAVPGAAAPPQHSFQVTTVFRTTTIVTTVHHTPSPPPPPPASSSPWPPCPHGGDAASCSALEPSEDILVVVAETAAAEDEGGGPTPSLHRTFPPEATPTMTAILTPTPTLRRPAPTATPVATPRPGVTAGDAETLPQFWLLTVLRGPEGEEPIAGVLAARLARLYKKAFMRQQERHLGIISPGSVWRGMSLETSTLVPRPHPEGTATRGVTHNKWEAEWANSGGVPGWRRPRALDPVLVRILRVTKREDGKQQTNDRGEDPPEEELELLYSVHVGGRPVPAKTAAEDMRLITDEEAATELGYAVVTKAEPYLKDSGRSMSSNGGGAWKGHAWAVVVVAVAAGILVLLLAALLAYVAKRQRKKQRQRRLVSGAEPTDVSALASSGAEEDPAGNGRGAANRRQVFESGACTNLGYEGAEGDPDAKRVIRPAGASKGSSSWLPKHSDVFPAPSAPPRRPESAVSLDGERHPRRSGGGRKAQFRSPPHSDERRHPSSSLDHHQRRRLETGVGEGGEMVDERGDVVDYHRQGPHPMPRGVEDVEVEEDVDYSSGGAGIFRVSSSSCKRRGGGRGERVVVRRKRRPSAGRGPAGVQQQHQRYPSASAVRMEESCRGRGVIASPSPPPPEEDLMGVSDGEQDWITSPLPIHRSMASPTSYLSMPSVRAFPKGANIPEPLTLVLEGNRHPVARDSVSIRHLDIYPEASAFEPQRKGGYPTSALSRRSRHGSIDGEDPGVLGPKVFEVVRRQRELRRESSLIVGGSRGSLIQRPDDNLILPLGEGARLRRRFHDLLDDTLILFGKRYGEQTKTEKLDSVSNIPDDRRSSQNLRHHLPPPGPSRVDFRSQSAYARAEEPLLGYMERPPRPKTSMSRPLTSDMGGNAWSAGGHRRTRVASAGPRGAWGPTDDSPSSSGRVSSTLGLFTRPVSAGPYHHHMTSIPPSVPHDSPPPPAPSIDTTHVMVDPQMPTSDPAIPLIQAIKAELRKFHTNDTPS